MDKEIKPQHQSSTDYRVAVEAIKTAILQSQYEAAKNVNRVQLTVNPLANSYGENYQD